MSVKLSGDRYEEIKNEVVCLFEKADVHCTPISGYEIAASLNVNVIPYSAFTASKRELAIKLSPDGFAAFDSGKWRICVNDDGNIAFGRRNFTILHELGHIVLQHTEDSDLADAEANFFCKVCTVSADTHLSVWTCQRWRYHGTLWRYAKLRQVCLSVLQQVAAQ